jgi:excisionase family DNA binding protein
MPRLLTVSQFSQQLGIQPSTTRSWLWKRRIEFIKVGRCVRIKESEVNRLLKQGRVPASKEISSPAKD